MQSTTIIRQSKIVKTPRVQQLEGIFDVPPSDRSEEKWEVKFDLPESWNVGVIVGPSGSGKSTVAKELFGKSIVESWDWPKDKSLLDGFPKDMSIKDICGLLSSVGFSSPPSWVRPFHVLSNGEQFRVNMARTLAESTELSVVDEFTSVVDRTVAQIGSAAIAKTVRRCKQQFIAVSCHYDILDWLEPDWVYQPHINKFELTRGLLRRPEIKLEVRRVHHSAWELFRKHHYLDSNLNKSAACFVAFYQDQPVAFNAVLHFPHSKVKNIKRESRTVCLPDFQGVGIGNAMSNYIGSMCRGLGYRYLSQTSHPGMIQYRAKSKDWKMKQAPTYKRSIKGKRSSIDKWCENARTRLVASFEYVGAAMPRDEAKLIWG